MKHVLLKNKLPLNFQQWMERFFIPIQNTFVKIPGIKKLKHVFVTNQGLVIKNNKLVIGSAFNLKGNLDNTFYWPYWKLAVEQKIVCRFGKSLKYKKLNDDKTYLLIHSKWFNYSFWINSFLVRLIQAEQAGLLPELILIYPQEWDSIPYVVESLQCFNLQKEVIPSDHHLFVEHLIMPETREWSAIFHEEHVTMVKNKIVPEALERTTLKKFPKHIYLTRKKRSVRCIENEEVLIPILKKYDVEILNFEDYSFWDQVALMHHADSFISIHGAGFSNVIFMQEGSLILELVNQQYAEAEYKMPFWKLSVACNHHYFVQFGKVNENASKLLRRGSNHDNVNRYLADENIVIDVKLFEENIQQMMAFKQIE